MATMDCTTDTKYNSPYTGPQLDKVISTVLNNTLYTFQKVYTGDGSNGPVSIKAIPPKPDGTKTGVYDVLYGTAPEENAGSVARIIIDDLGITSGGSGHTDIGSNRVIYSSHIHYDGVKQEFTATVDIQNIDDPSDPGNGTDVMIAIKSIYRLEPIS
jgi:hypothetical protein